MDPASIKRLTDAARKVQFHWYKEGSVYRISMDGGGIPLISGPGYLKVEKGQLIPCTQQGFPGGFPWTRG